MRAAIILSDFDYYPNPDDPDGAYWKMDRGTLRKMAPDWKPTPVGDYPTYDYENGILTIPRVDTPEQAGMFQDARMELTGEGHWLLTGLKTAGTRPFYPPTITKIELIVTETFPVQVFLKVSGFLPGSAQFLGKIPQRLKGNVFEIFIYGENLYSDPGFPMSVTIEEVIPLSVYGLSAGTYEYSLNGGCSMSQPGAGCIPETFTGTFVLTQDNNL